jgi:hypothetical protein
MDWDHQDPFAGPLKNMMRALNAGEYPAMTLQLPAYFGKPLLGRH